MTTPVAKSYYWLEPHERWTDEGQIWIDGLATKVYGKTFDSLRAAQQEDDRLGNDQVKIYNFEDESDYLQAIHDFDEKEIYLGYNERLRQSFSKSGMTAMEYWLSIKTSDNPDEVTVEANPPVGTDLEGAVFEDIFYANRAFSPGLRLVLADLIRRGEIPQANYIFHHWW